MIDYASFKKVFFYTLVTSLVVAALVAVVAVLVGEFSDIAFNALFTLLMVIIHTFICLAFIWEDEKENTFENLNFFTTAVFILIVASFLVSVFGIWDVIGGQTISDLYQTFFVLAFAALHGDILSKALSKNGHLDTIVYINYFFMAVVVLMLIPILFLNAKALVTLGEFFFRILGAAAIIDGTLSILAIIFYKKFLHEHPRVQSSIAYNYTYQNPQNQKKVKKTRLSWWVWILAIYLFFQIVVPIFGFFLMAW